MTELLQHPEQLDLLAAPILKTGDYGLFKFLEYNREIENAHVENLKSSISARNLTASNPILVTKEMEIVDGQHRFMACKALGFSVYYRVVDNFQATDLISLNSVAKSWNTEAYLKFYAAHGYVEYVKVEDFIRRTQIPFNFFYSIGVTGSGSKDTFRAGAHKFSDKMALKIESTYTFYKDLLKIIEPTYMKKNRPLYNPVFFSALSYCLNFPGLNKEEFFDRLVEHSAAITARAGHSGYFELLLQIYNWKRQKNRIEFNKKNYFDQLQEREPS